MFPGYGERQCWVELRNKFFSELDNLLTVRLGLRYDKATASILVHWRMLTMS